MRILVLGSYYSNNLGDGVICECTAGRLQKHFPDAEIVIRDLMNRQSFRREEPHTIERLDRIKLRMKLRELLSRYTMVDKELANQENRLKVHRDYIHEVCSEQYDIAVFAGGQVFRDSYALLIEEFVSQLAAKNTKIFFNACGSGPLNSPAIQKRLEKVFRHPCVRLLSSRDDAEKINRLCLGGEELVVQTFDPALWSDVHYNMTGKEDAPYVGLGMMYPWTLSTKKTAVYWRKVIRRLDAEKIEWRVFTNGDHNDLPFVEYVFSGMEEYRDSYKDFIMPVPERPKQLTALLSEFNSIISFRLHSHIISASLGIPSVAVVWDDKVKRFFDKMKCGDRCVSIKTSSEETLKKLTEARRQRYTHCRLEEMKEYADQLLIQSIREAMGEEQQC